MVDRTFDRQKLEALFKSWKPDVVFHLASHFVVEHTSEDLQRLVESNILFGTVLVDAMAAAGCHRIVNATTSWTHYQQEVYNPVCLYAATKEAFRSILKFYETKRALKTVNLELYDTYGPGDRRRKLIPTILGLQSTSKPMELSPGEQLVYFVYIDDVVSALIRAADIVYDSSTPSQTFCVRGAAPLALKQFLQAIQVLLPPEIADKIQVGKKSYRDNEVMVPWDAGPVLPGWAPTIDLEEGIKRCLNS